MIKVHTLLGSVGLITTLVGLNMGLAAADTTSYLPSAKVTQLLKSSTTWVGQPVHYPITNDPEVTFLQVEIPPGGETGWHLHPVPSYVYVVAGQLTVKTQKNTIVVQAGQTFIEAVNVLHDGKNLGPEPVKLIVVYTGIKNQPLTVKLNSHRL